MNRNRETIMMLILFGIIAGLTSLLGTAYFILNEQKAKSDLIPAPVVVSETPPVSQLKEQEAEMIKKRQSDEERYQQIVEREELHRYTEEKLKKALSEGSGKLTLRGVMFDDEEERILIYVVSNDLTSLRQENTDIQIILKTIQETYDMPYRTLEIQGEHMRKNGEDIVSHFRALTLKYPKKTIESSRFEPSFVEEND